MTPLELLQLASTGYPDSLEAHFDEQTGEPRDGGGDTLALFVVNELFETFDEDNDTPDQLETAIGMMKKAVEDLEGVIKVLKDAAIKNRRRVCDIRTGWDAAYGA